MRCLHVPFVALLLLFIAALSGCGEGNSGVSSENVPSASTASSQGCINCHSGVNSPVVATARICEEWQNSNHNTAKTGKQYGAGCADCHEPEVGHPGSCSRCHGGTPSKFNVTGADVTRNPDEQQKCYKCHHSRTLSSGHFSKYTSADGPGSFVSKNFANNCRACHNPHDVSTLLYVNKDWAASKHGNPNEVAWQHYDFKIQSRTACIRCHTTTGYINYVTGAATAFPATTWATAGDKTKEVLACNACHESYDFKNSVRKLPAFTAPYGGSTATPAGLYPVTYPDAGQSNICIRCHAGRESGGSIDDASDAIGHYGSISAQTAINGTSFKNSHYLGAAEVFYGKAGFHYYTSMKKYDTGFNTGAKFGTWSHGRLGTVDPATGKNFVAVQGTATASTITNSGTEGPCIACHMGNQGGVVNPRSHTFSPLEVAKSTAPAGGCYGCHGATGSAPENMAHLIEEERVLFDYGMDFFKWNLLNNQIGNKAPIYYDSTVNPYFFSDPVLRASANQFKQWSMGTGINATGIRVEGACFNLNLLSREMGAHVHNRTYARRLIYDSIQYLQYGSVSVTDTTKKVSFAAYSTANPGLTTKVNFTLGPVSYTGAGAIRAWLTSGSRTTGVVTGFRK